MNIKPLELAKLMCDYIIDTHEPDDLMPTSRPWFYGHGLFMCALQRIYEQCGNKRYLEYTKKWADGRIDGNGEFYFRHKVDKNGFPYLRLQLDAIQPGLALFKLYEKYGDERYRTAIENLYHLLLQMPKTSDGGYWHGHTKPYQMWLDGLYMAEPFTMQYYLITGKNECLDAVWKQVKLMTEHTLDEKTGLLYHAWDELRAEDWAEQTNGHAPEFWGRALGWYGLAIADILDNFPEEREEYSAMREMLARMITSVCKYQDESGLWYQIVNKGERSDNWLETSCSCLYLYTISKCVRLGIIDQKYAENAKRAYEGVLSMTEIDGEKVVLKGVCEGTNVGEYDFYIKAKTIDNDLHGIGACLLALSEYAKIAE